MFLVKYCLFVLVSAINASWAMIESINEHHMTIALQKALPQITRQLVQATVEEHDNHYAFGTDENNHRSFQNWLSFSTGLLVLSKMGDEEAKEQLISEIERKLRRLDSIDAYVPRADRINHSLYLEGIWEQVASFDESTRQDLIRAYETGDLGINANPEKAKFWKEFSSSFLVS